RIQQIEGNFNRALPTSGPSFAQVLQQQQGMQAGANFNPNMMQAPGMTGMMGQPSLGMVNPSLWSMINPQQSMQPGAYPVTGDQLEKMAASMDGKQYWPNACAHAVNDALKQMGIDIKEKVNNNPEWVPNYADLGQKVTKMDDMKPGDLVIYNNYLGQGGYDHIGIYAGNGEAWNVSTAAGYKWVKRPIGDRFQEARRITAN
ncbi:MAG: NlpC/P60 family protein, partial [Armatimonadetes bacterium]|nr:NlpC/P60 family protein [Armatimonadota bacterium]